MQIEKAKQAERFYRIPMAVHRVILAETIGRGEVVTLLRLTAYLWSDQSIEGTRAEWAVALGVEAQTFEAHVPALGRAGVLSYTQPHVGYYRFFGLAQTDAEVQALQAAWRQAAAEWPTQGLPARQRYVWQTQRVEALKLTLPVIDHSSSSVLTVVENPVEPASKLTLEPSKSTLATDPASQVTLEPALAPLAALYAQEIGGTVTVMLAAEFRDLWARCSDMARWRYAFEKSLGKGNRWAYVKAVVTNTEQRSPVKEQFARNQHNSKELNNPNPDSTALSSADIAAWFGEQ